MIDANLNLNFGAIASHIDKLLLPLFIRKVQYVTERTLNSSYDQRSERESPTWARRNSLMLHVFERWWSNPTARSLAAHRTDSLVLCVLARSLRRPAPLDRTGILVIVSCCACPASRWCRFAPHWAMIIAAVLLLTRHGQIFYRAVVFWTIEVDVRSDIDSISGSLQGFGI